MKLAGQVTGHFENVAASGDELHFEVLSGNLRLEGKSSSSWGDVLAAQTSALIRFRGTLTWERLGESFRPIAIHAAECVPATFELESSEASDA